MESFKLWLEGNTDIQYLGDGKYAGQAWVRFSIKGKVYEYAVDPAFLEPYSKDSRRFYATKHKAPGIALNLAKKHGTLIEPKPKPKPKPQPKPAPANWPEDWELENRKQQARMQGDDVPF
jgi:hypothetical protein